jgi:hypothetical protein
VPDSCPSLPPTPPCAPMPTSKTILLPRAEAGFPGSLIESKANIRRWRWGASTTIKPHEGWLEVDHSKGLNSKCISRLHFTMLYHPCSFPSFSRPTKIELLAASFLTALSLVFLVAPRSERYEPQWVLVAFIARFSATIFSRILCNLCGESIVLSDLTICNYLRRHDWSNKQIHRRHYLRNVKK